jgi:integrase
MPPRIPKYRRRPDRNVAFAEHPRGRRTYFPGRYDSPESRAAYNRWLRGVLGEPEAGIDLPADPGLATVADLVLAFLGWAKLYYLQNGKVGSEYHCLRSASIPLLKVADSIVASHFGPRDLKAVRTEMGDRKWTRETVNAQVGRIRRIFRWGVEHELVRPQVLQAIQAVAPLRKGRTGLQEGRGVQPVDPAHVAAVLPRVGPVVAAMIRLQQVAGMRPQDVCQLRPADIDRSGKVWLYRQHKGEWRGEVRIVTFGPRAQKILKPWLARPEDAYCFSPAESEAARRTTRKRTARRGRPPRQRYDTGSYRRAIDRAIEALNTKAAEKAAKAGKPAPTPIPHWSPNQLRHNAATLVRAKYGIEAAQVYLGHARADVTQVYAERDLELARRIAREIG